LECQSDSDEPFHKKKRTQVDKQKLGQHLIVYVPVTRWQTGERAEMDEDATWFEVAEEARKDMLIAGLEKSYQFQANRAWILEEGARTFLTRHPLHYLSLFINV
jgi:hypothetical protein